MVTTSCPASAASDCKSSTGLQSLSTLTLAPLVLAHAGIFAETFRRLQRRGIVPGVLYPAVSIPSDEQLVADSTAASAPELAAVLGSGRCFLSVNRFERKKVQLVDCKSFVLTRTCICWTLPRIQRYRKYSADIQPRMVSESDHRKYASWQ